MTWLATFEARVRELAAEARAERRLLNEPKRTETEAYHSWLTLGAMAGDLDKMALETAKLREPWDPR